MKNIKNGYGINVEEEITKMLSEHLTREIDKEIINKLFSKRDLRKEKIKRIYK